MIEHLIDFSFLKSLYLAYIKIPMPFFIPFASFLMIFLFFVRQNRKRSFCLCVFSRLSFSKAFFFFSFFFFRLIVLSYYAASIKISLIPFIGILLFFFGFSDHFLIVNRHSQIPLFSSFSNTCTRCGVWS